MFDDHPLSAYGWNERVAALIASADQPADRPARVARVDRGAFTAVTTTGTERVTTRDIAVTTGDWVLLSTAEPPTVTAVLPRWSTLGRHDPGRAALTQLLAANVDVGLVVVGLDREPNLGRIDRLLTLVWSSGATPVVVLTKADLAPQPEQAAADVALATVGVEVVLASSMEGTGIEHIRALVPAGSTAVLLGVSGAGKSSLVNALVGADVHATGAIRAVDGKGRHTTRARELVALPGAGVLLDTPGVRGVGLASGHEEGVDRTFADVVGLAADCRFRDCHHDGEPGCAVRAAVEEGELDPSRLAAFRALEREVAAAARRADVRTERAAAKAWGRQHQQMRKEVQRASRSTGEHLGPR